MTIAITQDPAGPGRSGQGVHRTARCQRKDAASPAQVYLSVPPTLIGGSTLEIQLNVIAERVLDLPKG
jgi:hypothetical protein